MIMRVAYSTGVMLKANPEPPSRSRTRLGAFRPAAPYFGTRRPLRPARLSFSGLRSLAESNEPTPSSSSPEITEANETSTTENAVINEAAAAAATPSSSPIAATTAVATTTTPDEQQQAPSDEDSKTPITSEALMIESFIKAVAEIFKLAVLLPLRYLVFSPLGWLLGRVGVLSPPPTVVLSRLEASNATSPVDAAHVAATLHSINKHHPEAVVEFVESRCMLLDLQTAADGATAVSTGSNSNSISTSQKPTNVKFAVDANVVREYLIGLVKSGRIIEYGGNEELLETAATAGGMRAAMKAAVDADRYTAPPASTTIKESFPKGQSHRSLPMLLSQLQAAAEGRPLPAAPGAAAAWPLHVVLQGAPSSFGGGSGAGEPAGALGTIRSFLWFVISCLLFSLAWFVGVAAVRRYSAGGGMIAGGGMPGVSVSSGGNNAGAGSGGQSIFGAKEYSKENMPEKSVKKFSDVKGCDEAVTELQEIVAYLKQPEKFTKLGAKIPKGVLLTGPPGAGKTLLARAVAGEAGVPFFYKSGSEFDEMFVGVGSRRVRNLFTAAKKKSPCIVFIDEIDAVGGKRTNWESSGGSRKTLNQLLTDMDGFEENSGVVVMAATNLPELLDSALTRPGRFDRQVAVPLPDVNGRRAILELYLKDKPVAKDVDADNIARRTPGFSGAQLSNLINEAALLAARHDATEINAALLDEAKDKVLMGSPRTLAQSEEARRLTAYHEGGHALVALHTPAAKPIHKATIVPRGHALGMVMQVPDKDEYSTTKQQMIAMIDVAMGGKAAEELIFGADSVTSGATSDLKSATRLALHMVEDCGMSARLGPVALGVWGRDTGSGGGSSLSQEARRAVDEEVSTMLKDAYSRVARLLKEREGELHRLAEALLQKETLTLVEIKQLLGMQHDDETRVGGGEEEKEDAAAAAAVVDVDVDGAAMGAVNEVVVRSDIPNGSVEKEQQQDLTAK